MKQIELTEKHKSKLLEMCSKLFPKYDIRISRPLFSNNKSLSSIQLGEKCENSYSLEIHWFEFCMIHIFPKLNQMWNTEQLSYFYYIILGYTMDFKSNSKNTFIHPIDYLYKQFKELD